MMEQSPFQRPKRRLMSEMNVVPYIDVMLVLVVIFMVTAPMLTEGLKVELPEVAADTLNVDSTDTMIVTVKQDGSYWLKQGDHPDKRMALEDLIDSLQVMAAKQPDAPILLNGDKRVDYGKVVALMASLQKAGLVKVGLLTDAPDN